MKKILFPTVFYLLCTIYPAWGQSTSIIKTKSDAFSVNSTQNACIVDIPLIVNAESSNDVLNLSEFYRIGGYDYSKFIAGFGFGAPIWRGDSETPISPIKAGWDKVHSVPSYPSSKIPMEHAAKFVVPNYNPGGDMHSAAQNAVLAGFPNAQKMVDRSPGWANDLMYDIPTLHAIAQYYVGMSEAVDAGNTTNGQSPAYRPTKLFLWDEEQNNEIFAANFATELSKLLPNTQVLFYGKSPTHFASTPLTDYHGYHASISEPVISILKSKNNWDATSIFTNSHIKTGPLYIDGSPNYVKVPMPNTSTLYKKDANGNYILDNNLRILRDDDFEEIQFGIKNTWYKQPTGPNLSDDQINYRYQGRIVTDAEFAIGTPYRFLSTFQFSMIQNAVNNDYGVDISKWRNYNNKLIAVQSLLTEPMTAFSNSPYRRWIGEEQIKFNIMAPLMVGYAGVELWETGNFSDYFYNPDYTPPIIYAGTPLPYAGNPIYSAWGYEGHPYTHNGIDVNPPVPDNYSRYKWATKAVSVMREVYDHYTLDSTLRYVNFTRYGTAVGDKEIIILGMYQNSNLHIMAYYPYHDVEDTREIELFVGNQKHTFTLSGRNVLLKHFNVNTTGLEPDDFKVRYFTIDNVEKKLTGNLENHFTTSLPSSPSQICNTCYTPTPSTILTTGNNIPSGQGVTLTSSCSSGIVKWNYTKDNVNYSATGNSLTVNNLTSTTIFRASCEEENCTTSVGRQIVINIDNSNCGALSDELVLGIWNVTGHPLIARYLNGKYWLIQKINSNPYSFVVRGSAMLTRSDVTLYNSNYSDLVNCFEWKDAGLQGLVGPSNGTEFQTPPNFQYVTEDGDTFYKESSCTSPTPSAISPSSVVVNTGGTATLTSTCSIGTVSWSYPGLNQPIYGNSITISNIQSNITVTATCNVSGCSSGGNQTSTITLNQSGSFTISNINVPQNCDENGKKNITFTLAGGSGPYEANYNGGSWVPVYPNLIEWDPSWGAINIAVNIREVNNHLNQVSFNFSTNQCGQQGSYTGGSSGPSCTTPTPTSISASSTSVNSGGNVTLSSSCESGIVTWTSSNGTQTGNSITVTNITSNITYTVTCVDPSCTTGGNQTQTITVNNTFSISNISISQNCDPDGLKSITFTLSGGSGSYEANYNGGNWVPVYPDLIQWDPNWGSNNVNVTIRDLNNLSKQVSFSFSTNQCGQEGTFDITSPNARLRTDIEMQKVSDPISIYPNPSSGYFILNFTLEDKSIVNIFILSPTGNIIAQKAMEGKSGTNQTEFIIPNLKNGNYIIQIKSKTKTLTKLLNIHN